MIQSPQVAIIPWTRTAAIYRPKKVRFQAFCEDRAAVFARGYRVYREVRTCLGCEGEQIWGPGSNGEEGAPVRQD